MNKIVFSFICAVVLLVSCRPEVIISRRLDGKWDLKEINGETPTQAQHIVFEFEHGKGSSGEVIAENTVNGESIQKDGIYSVYKSSTITMAFSSNPNEDTRVFEIVERSKTSLKLKYLRTNETYLLEKR